MLKFDYNHQAQRWVRTKPKNITDLVARPFVLELFEKIGAGKDVLDLGCTEGYFCRLIAPIANKITGIDISEEVIKLAQESEREKSLGIQYCQGDVRNMEEIQESSQDVCVGNCITNYLQPYELYQFYDEMRRVLKADGQFVLSMPHPKNLLEMLARGDKMSMRLTDRKEFDYQESRGVFFPVELETLEGEVLEPGIYHSTKEDHYKALERSGLQIEGEFEPAVSEKIGEKFPLFSDLVGQRLYWILQGRI